MYREPQDVRVYRQSDNKYIFLNENVAKPDYLKKHGLILAPELVEKKEFSPTQVVDLNTPPGTQIFSSRLSGTFVEGETESAQTPVETVAAPRTPKRSHKKKINAN